MEWSTFHRNVALFILLGGTLAPGVFAWDPVRDLTGRTVKQHVERKVEKAGVAAQKLIRDPIGYLVRLPQSLLADLCSSPAQYYENTLRGQAHGRWNALPPDLIEAVQPAYSVDLRTVRYAERIRTANGAAQTFGNWIYFPRLVDLRNRGDLHWMLHELEHVVQYSGRYGYAGSLCEYMAKSVGTGFRHDSIDWERAADAKANWVIDYAHRVMSQGLPYGAGQASRLGRNQILIFNDTDQEVVFHMETSQTEEGAERLPARAWTIFTGGPADTWFNVRIGTNTPSGVQWITYGLNGSTRQHIMWNQWGLLDFFYE